MILINRVERLLLSFREAFFNNLYNHTFSNYFLQETRSFGLLEATQTVCHPDPERGGRGVDGNVKKMSWEKECNYQND